MTSYSRLESSVGQLLCTLAGLAARVVNGSGVATAADAIGFARERVLIRKGVLEDRGRVLTASVGLAPRPQGRVRFLTTLTLASAALLALTAAPASALDTHGFSISFGSAGSGDGQLSLQPETNESSGGSGIAVNSTTHDVYVADTGNARIDQFSSAGAFIRAFGADVGGPGVNVCTTGCLAGTPGSGPGAFTTPKYIAVDNSAGPSDGDIYVGDRNDVVTKFDASGTLITTWGSGGQLDGSTATDGPFSGLEGVAVDTSGNLWVLAHNAFVLGQLFEFAQDATFTTDWDSSIGVSAGLAVDSATNLYLAPFATKFTSVGTQIGPVTGGVITAPAIDAATDDLYVSAGTQIDHYAPSCDPSGGPCTPADSFGSGNLASPTGLAVDSSSHAVYAADTGNARIDAFVPITLPDVTTGSATAIAPAAATLNGIVNPAGLAVTDCHFDYVDDAHYDGTAPNPYLSGNTAPCAETVGSGSSDVPVHADIAGLTAGTTYHFRLQASNADGTNFGTDQTFSTLPPPSVDFAAAQNLTPTDADLTAHINPNGYDTTYRFEWGTADCTASPCTPIPVPDAHIGSGTADVPVTQHLSGLTQNTTYHWRLIATNANGTVGAGVDHTFVYDTSGQGLPDNRAYEMVTPPQKNGALIGDLFLFGAPPSISAAGSTLMDSSLQCFGDAAACPAHRTSTGSPYAFNRTTGGWQTTSLTPPATQFGPSTSITYSADAGTALFSMSTPPAGEDDFYARQPDGTFVDIGPITPPPAGALGPLSNVDISYQTPTLTNRAWQVSSASDLSTSPARWPFDPGQDHTLTAYQYSGAGNSQPLLVGVGGLNDGPGSTDLISTCGTKLGAGFFIPPGVLSADGHTLYFAATACSGGSGANAGTPVPAQALYARVDGALPDAHTVPISQRSPADCTGTCTSSPPGDAQFEGASADGSKAFFASTQQLTDAASEDSQSGDSAAPLSNSCSPTTGPNGCNLYLYDSAKAAGHELTAVSAGDTSGGGPRLQGVLAISSDGSHVYFVAKGVLTGQANSQGQTATGGANNLYAYDSASGETSFIAALPSSDSAEWLNGAGAPANVTPDGRFLVFTSHGALTPDATSRSGARQIFRYDDQSADLIRISIGDNGFNDNGNRSTNTPCSPDHCSEDAAIAPPAFFVSGRTDPTMSHDGSYVFFTSPVALTPHALDDVQIDSGGNSGAPFYEKNVYEWHAGHVSLISDGRDVSENHGGHLICQTPSSVCLLGSDATGQNVFFTTTDQLVPQDTDTELDIYDARVGGGFPYTPPPEPCNGDNCKPPASGAPPLETAGSVTFTGPGNVSPDTATATVKVLSGTVHGFRFVLKVRVPARGEIAITGASIKTVRKSASRAGTYRINVTLTPKARTALKHKRKLKLRLHITYRPATGASSSVTFSIMDKA